MIDCNWSWNLQLQNPLVCFSWLSPVNLHQLYSSVLLRPECGAYELVRMHLYAVFIIKFGRNSITLLLLLFAGTIFCEFLRFGKIAKLSTRKNFYRHIITVVYAQSQTVWCWPLFGAHANHSFLIFSGFSFLPSRAITSLGKWHFLMSIVGVSRANLRLKLCSWRITGGRCTIWHVSCKSTQYYIAASSV